MRRGQRWLVEWVAGACACGAIAVIASGCGGGSTSGSRGDARAAAAAAAGAKPTAIVLVTIDTLRADRVGAYGWRAARTPAIDALAARGVRFDHAYAAAPITLTSHASLLTGLNPPAHGARHNGMRLRADVPTLAELLHARGFATGAFVAAFPLDRRFGLDRGFDVYSDTLRRGPDGRPRNERPGREVVDEALAWLAKREANASTAASGGGNAPFFLWVHLFEPHAPYEGDPARSASDRYDDEIAKADAQVARLVQAVDEKALFIVTGDHGEAFGEHGEIGHSIFVYDTTLRVPLVFAGLPKVATHAIGDPVSLVDVVPTILELSGAPKATTNGQSLAAAIITGATLGARPMYAESFAPLLDFGWSPLRTLRVEHVKYIAAPKPELYDIQHDPAEAHNAVAQEPTTVKSMATSLDRIYAGSADAPSMPADAEALGRLRSLGYLASSTSTSASTRTPGAGAGAAAGDARPDPKDRIDIASRIAEVTSGELQGAALRTALERLVREDPKNGQMRMRLGFVLLEAGECRAAMPHFEAAIKAAVPSADPQLGLAECLIAAGQHAPARRALEAADKIEPGNPVVAANLGMLSLDAGNVPDAIDRLRAALDRAPDLHQARFALARAYGRAGRREDAAREASELLKRLPPDAPQRAEVQRLLAAVQ